MIAVRLAGGLGNQLFQVSAALYLRDVDGRRVVLDRGWFSSPTAQEPRRRLEVAGATDGLRLVPVPWRLHHLGSRLGAARYVLEGEPHDDALERVTRRTLAVRGYFQLARIPEAVVPALRRVVLARIPEALGPAATEPYVAVHCRLGDYVSNPAVHDLLGVSDPAELLAGAGALAASLGGLPVRVFTDSHTLLGRLCGDLPAGVELSRATEPWAVLAEIAGARGIVMANSSLSWWAAFVATRLRGDDVEVHFPVPWFAAASPSDELLRVDGWHATPRRLLPG